MPVSYTHLTNEELEQKGQIPVSFDGLHTWASLYNGRLSVKAEASNIRKVDVYKRQV